jgi:Activator of Hsp90 ATPase, N-terminal
MLKAEVILPQDEPFYAGFFKAWPWLANFQATVKTTGIDSVTGDAVLNCRKKKLIAIYELDIKVSWRLVPGSLGSWHTRVVSANREWY